MCNIIRSFVFLAVLFVCSSAHAATCFWVGGTGNYDSVNIVSWASGTGGTASTCAATGGIPKNAGDIATFDGASGGGTVTVCGASAATCPSSSGNLNIGQVTMGAFTGALDFATRNPAVTLSVGFSGTGTGTRTLNMGSGAWTVNSGGSGSIWNMATTTGLTFNAGTSTLTLNISSAAPIFAGGGLTYSTVAFNINSTGNGVIVSGANTFATWQLGAGISVSMPQSTTTTVTNAYTFTGTSSAPISFSSSTFGTAATVSTASGTATCAWCVFRAMAFTGGATFTASNSLNSGLDTGITITPPTVGGSGGFVIGG